MKKILVLLLSFLLLISEFGCSKKKTEEPDEPVEEEEELVLDDFWAEENEIEETAESDQQILFEDYENEAISADDVVSLSLEMMLDNEEENTGFNLSSFDSFALEHWDELDLSTKEDYCRTMFYSDIDFEYEADDDTVFEKIEDCLFETVDAKEIVNNKINKVILSDNGHFLIWYTTKGNNAVTNSYAQ